MVYKMKAGNGENISVWHDHWSSISPISNIVSLRDVHRAGSSQATVVKDIVQNDQWLWPHAWYSKYPILESISVPVLNPNELDVLEWRNSLGDVRTFAVTEVWDCIRPQGDKVNWCDILWFKECIPRHAFHVWLIFLRKLKTQDLLKQWDTQEAINVTLLQCPVCSTQPDSHDHLFFECSFSLQIWNHMKMYAGLPTVSNSLSSIIDLLISMSKSSSASSVIANLVFAGSTYFVWQEINGRLFKNQRRTPAQLFESIKSTVRLILISCRLKKMQHVMPLMHLWRLPESMSSDS